MKLELARTGSYNGVVITPEDLLSMAQTFVSDVPVTIGHEADDSMPAYGWVRSVEVSADGTVLTGEIDLGSELAEAFSDGKYKNWSIGAARDDSDRLYLHHVAFLGAVPPMIKDLRIIEMKDRADMLIIPARAAEFIMSDRELAEYAALRTEKAASRISELKKASEGKLPLKHQQSLITFADSLERDHPDLDAAKILAGIFSSVSMPVRVGAHASSGGARFQSTMFSKI